MSYINVDRRVAVEGSILISNIKLWCVGEQGKSCSDPTCEWPEQE